VLQQSRVTVKKDDRRLFLLDPHKGFTLMEVMIGLIVGTLIVGGVMGLISSSLQYNQRVKEKTQLQPLLEAAAQEVLAHPEKALDGTLTFADMPEAPPVDIDLAKVIGPDGDIVTKSAQLYRVRLSCRGHVLEFSLLIPQSKLK